MGELIGALKKIGQYLKKNALYLGIGAVIDTVYSSIYKKMGGTIDYIPYKFKKKEGIIGIWPGVSASIYSLLSPDILIGILPLYNCQRVEFTTSQDILKYRAVGGQFLAKQSGSNWAMRVDAEFGPIEAPFAIWILNLLFYYGMEKNHVEEMITTLTNDKFYNNQITYTSNTPNSFNGEKSMKDMPKKGVYPDENDDNIFYKNTSIDDWDFFTNKWHTTFTIVTREQIYTNVFIESFIFYQDINKSNGKNLHVSILFRRFTRPPRLLDVVNYRGERDKYIGARMTETQVEKNFPTKSGETTSVTIVADGDERQHVYKIDKNGKKIEDEVVNGKVQTPTSKYLSYGYVKKNVNLQYGRQLKYEYRTPPNLDEIVLVMNCIRRAYTMAATFITNNNHFKTVEKRLITQGLDSSIKEVGYKIYDKLPITFLGGGLSPSGFNDEEYVNGSYRTLNKYPFPTRERGLLIFPAKPGGNTVTVSCILKKYGPQEYHMVYEELYYIHGINLIIYINENRIYTWEYIGELK